MGYTRNSSVFKISITNQTMDISILSDIIISEASTLWEGTNIMTTFSRNLKRLRIAKKLTQEQAAQALGVSAQTVSRWECNTTLPDVLLLPKIAALYAVTVDDLYKESSVAYENYASRLCSVFEASHKPEDFMQAYWEYQKLFKSKSYTTEDLRSYAILHQYMMQLCRDKAEEVFRNIIDRGPSADPDTYWATQRQKIYFLWEIGRNQESIDTFLPLVEAGNRLLQEWICLIQAYSLAGDFNAAWTWIQKAETKFPESAMLHIYAGDLLRDMKRFDEAFIHWKRALEMEPEWLSSAYSMASCYEDLGDLENAAAVYDYIANSLESRGFDVEATWPRSMAREFENKISHL